MRTASHPLFFVVPFFGRILVLYQFRIAVLEFSRSFFLLVVGEVVFFAIPHFGRVLFSLAWISSPSNLMNSLCAFFSLLVVMRIAIFRNYSFWRLFSLSWCFSFVIPHSPCVLVSMLGEVAPVEERGTPFGIILGKSL